MSSITSPPAAGEQPELLDQLLPRPLSPLRRWVIGAGLFSIVLVGGILWLAGYVIPRPFATASFGSSRHIIIDPDGQFATASVSFGNFSNRTVRLTAVDLEATGLRLVASRASVVPPGIYEPKNCNQLSDSTTVCEAEASGSQPIQMDDADTLPVAISPEYRVELFLRFELSDPTQECPKVQELWGSIAATFDFGDGSFPPLVRTLALEERLSDDFSSVSISTAGAELRNDDFHVGPQRVMDALCTSLKPG